MTLPGTREAFCLRLDMPDPGDASALVAALAAGDLPRDGLLAVLLKTPGNGLTNDWTRALATRVVLGALAPGPQPMILASGGTEGVAMPHLLAIGTRAGTSPRQGALAVGHGTGPALAADAEDMDVARATAAALDVAMSGAGMAGTDLEVALVKVPLPTPMAFAGTEEAYATLKGRRRGAAALGAAAALGEVPWSAIGRADEAVFGRRTLVAAGTDVAAPEALVLGRAPGWGGSLSVAATMLADMLDAHGAAGLLGRLGLRAAPQLAGADAGRLRALIVKGEMPAQLRGARPAALDDSDIHPNRHFRAALSGMLGALTGETRVFLSGGSEHQTPPGGVLLAAIAETMEETRP